MDFIESELMQNILLSNPHLARRFWRRLATLLAKQIRKITLTRKDSDNKSMEKSGYHSDKRNTFCPPDFQDDPSIEAREMNDDLELKKIFGFKETLIVLKKYPVTMDFSKGYLYITRTLICFAGSIFGFKRKESIPVSKIKKTAFSPSNGNLVLVTEKEKYLEFKFHTGGEDEALNLISTLAKSKSGHSSETNEQGKATPKLRTQGDYNITLDDWKTISKGNKSKQYQPNGKVLTLLN